MMSPHDIVVIGIDPGPRPGAVALRYSPPDAITGIRVVTSWPAVVQCTSNVLLVCVRAILPTDVQKIIIGYEDFVIGRKTARTANRGASKETVQQCGMIETLAGADHRIIIRKHTASDVMTWAIDERLDRVELLALTKGMTHARAAARHALYTAKKVILAPDPLSKNHRRIEVSA
jgi:hypothetical protein